MADVAATRKLDRVTVVTGSADQNRPPDLARLMVDSDGAALGAVA